MTKPQYGILRFAKYKGPEIGRIEAHNERTKENYASNPDVDTERSKYNFHLVKPNGKYRAEAEKQIAEVGCRTRTDSVRVVETLITASPEFFKDKKKSQIKEYFEHALKFILKHVPQERILSAVIHVDEKTPHMHLSFVPITDDGRLSAKDIVGNRKKLTWWQDEFWKHIVKKYPDMERGESASETGREHIPPRLFKQAVKLNKQREMLMNLLTEINPLNAKKKAAEIEALLDEYIPGVEQMKTKLKKYDTAYKTLKTEITELEKKLDDSKESTLKKLEVSRKLQEYEELRKTVENIPPEILGAYKNRGKISTQEYKTNLE